MSAIFSTSWISKLLGLLSSHYPRTYGPYTLQIEGGTNYDFGYAEGTFFNLNGSWFAYISLGANITPAITVSDYHVAIGGVTFKRQETFGVYMQALPFFGIATANSNLLNVYKSGGAVSINGIEITGFFSLASKPTLYVP